MRRKPPKGKICWRVKFTNGTQSVIAADEIKFKGQKVITRQGDKWADFCNVSELLGKPKVLGDKD